MKILIYASEIGHSTKRLLDEIEIANKKNSDLEVSGEVIHVYDLYSYCSESTSGYDRVYRRGSAKSEKLVARDYQAVIPRLAGTGFDFGLVNLRHLNRNLNIFSTGSDAGLKFCSNKFLTCQMLSEHGLRVPKQVLAHRPTDYKELIDMVDGLPCVAKLQRGSQGAGVFILNDVLAASTALRAMEQTQVDVVLNRFIDTGSPANDLRIITVGAETENPKIFAYKRFAVDSDFRSNYSISKKGEKVEITSEERDMALRASILLGGGVHGVDIMRDSKDKDKPYIIEVNGCPGLAGIESVTGENVAAAIIQYVIENFKRKGLKKQTTNNGASAEFIGNQSKEFLETVKWLEKNYYPQMVYYGYLNGNIDKQSIKHETSAEKGSKGFFDVLEGVKKYL
jgi:ribosomal protein S6--L-glutamate ligase